MLPTDKTKQKLEKLRALLRSAKKLLIVMQDNPDPDAIATALVLRELAHLTRRTKCSLAHGGTVGRSENRALVKYLDVNLRQIDEVDLDKFDRIALVDSQPETGNNSLPNEVPPHIVLDHHPLRKATRSVEFYDVRNEYGATATLALEYLLAAGGMPDVPLATAIIYAIRSDTQDLGMEACKKDVEAIELLFPIANKRMLSVIQRGQVQRSYYQMLFDGLQNARIYGKKCVITSLGDIGNPDMIGEVADLMLRDDEASWSLCCGIYQDTILLSLRTQDQDARADKVIRKIVARRGSGGGHATIAGGQMPLKKDTKTERAKLEKVIRNKLLTELGLGDNHCSRLIR